MERLLVIRGGAIGDFILTLPAIGALRRVFPHASIEVMGNPRRAILAHHPAYANAITDMESWDLFRLFSPYPRVSEALEHYLASFELMLSYVPSPDDTFAGHLQRYGRGATISWHPQPPTGTHATDHLLQPVRRLAPDTFDPHPSVYVNAEAAAAAETFWQQAGLPPEGVVGLHPGSGGQHKLWPLAGWQQVMAWVANQGIPGLLIGGPAEHERITALSQDLSLPRWPCAGVMPLPHLAALLARCQLVVGHDSGVSHLAAAVGTPTLALFGPTDPFMWGPRQRQACVLRPQPSGPLSLKNLPPELVIHTLAALRRGTFVYTPSRAGCTILEVMGSSIGIRR